MHSTSVILGFAVTFCARTTVAIGDPALIQNHPAQDRVHGDGEPQEQFPPSQWPTKDHQYDTLKDTSWKTYRQGTSSVGLMGVAAGLQKNFGAMSAFLPATLAGVQLNGAQRSDAEAKGHAAKIKEQQTKMHEKLDGDHKDMQAQAEEHRARFEALKKDGKTAEEANEHILKSLPAHQQPGATSEAWQHSHLDRPDLKHSQPSMIANAAQYALKTVGISHKPEKLLHAEGAHTPHEHDTQLLHHKHDLNQKQAEINRKLAADGIHARVGFQPRKEAHYTDPQKHTDPDPHAHKAQNNPPQAPFELVIKKDEDHDHPGSSNTGGGSIRQRPTGRSNQAQNKGSKQQQPRGDIEMGLRGQTHQMSLGGQGGLSNQQNKDHRLQDHRKQGTRSLPGSIKQPSYNYPTAPRQSSGSPTQKSPWRFQMGPQNSKKIPRPERHPSDRSSLPHQLSGSSKQSSQGSPRPGGQSQPHMQQLRKQTHPVDSSAGLSHNPQIQPQLSHSKQQQAKQIQHPTSIHDRPHQSPHPPLHRQHSAPAKLQSHPPQQPRIRPKVEKHQTASLVKAVHPSGAQSRQSPHLTQTSREKQTPHVLRPAPGNTTNHTRTTRPNQPAKR